MRRIHDGVKGKKFMVYLIGFIMVFSVFGVIFFGYGNNGSVSTRYNHYKFTSKDNLWSTTVDGKQALFTYLPSQVEPIEVNDNVIGRLKGVIEIDITSEFNDTYAEEIALAGFQMGITLNNFNMFVRNGFTNEKEKFPVITCQDATSFVPVIYFKSSNETKVHLENNCIIAEAFGGVDVVRIKDRLLYSILGVIE